LAIYVPALLDQTNRIEAIEFISKGFPIRKQWLEEIAVICRVHGTMPKSRHNVQVMQFGNLFSEMLA